MVSDKPAKLRYQFGQFTLDTSERQLRRENKLVPLTPKLFDTLLVLVENSGRLVTKEELLTRLRPDAFVEETTLTHNISDLRKALQDGQNGRKFIETVPKHGYRFVAPVSACRQETSLLTPPLSEAEDSPAPLSAPERPPLSQSRLNTRLTMLLVSGVLIVVGALSWREFSRSKTTPGEPQRAFQEMQLSRFTASGNVVTATVSPDGKYVATVLNEDGLQSLWVRQTAANTSGVRLLAPAQIEYWGLTFSNDSNYLYYVLWVRNQSDTELFQLPVLGGAPRKIPVDGIDTAIGFAPAGDRFAYVVSSSLTHAHYVKTATVDGSEKQTLEIREKPGFVAAYPGGPAWSPDGKFVAYAASGLAEADRRQMMVFVVNVADKTERRLSEQSWGEIGRVAWLGDGSGLVIAARNKRVEPRQLWLISYPTGAARKITNDLHDYNSISLSGDARTLTAVQTQTSFTLSIAPYGQSPSAALSQPRELLSEVGGGEVQIAWTPDNRLVYNSRASGNWDIWSINKDGSDPRQLTFDPHNNLFPVVSADGRSLFFASDQAGAYNIWRMEFEGLRQTQVTHNGTQLFPELTPDGRYLIYQQGFGLDGLSIWRVAMEGGTPEQLSGPEAVERQGKRPEVSPDGQWLAYVAMDEKGWGITVRPLDSGNPVRRLPFPSSVWSHVFRWTPDGQALAYIANEKGAANLWLQPLSGAPPSQLTRFKTDQLSSFAWSTDGQWLAYLHQATFSDVVVLTNFK